MAQRSSTSRWNSTSVEWSAGKSRRFEELRTTRRIDDAALRYREVLETQLNSTSTTGATDEFLLEDMEGVILDVDLEETLVRGAADTDKLKNTFDRIMDGRSSETFKTMDAIAANFDFQKRQFADCNRQLSKLKHQHKEAEDELRKQLSLISSMDEEWRRDHAETNSLIERTKFATKETSRLAEECSCLKSLSEQMGKDSIQTRCDRDSLLSAGDVRASDTGSVSDRRLRLLNDLKERTARLKSERVWSESQVSRAVQLRDNYALADQKNVSMSTELRKILALIASRRRTSETGLSNNHADYKVGKKSWYAQRRKIDF